MKRVFDKKVEEISRIICRPVLIGHLAVQFPNCDFSKDYIDHLVNEGWQECKPIAVQIIRYFQNER